MDWRTFFFGSPRNADDAKPAEPIAPAAGNGGETVYANAPETELSSSKQHRWLFDEGVMHWNQHRHDAPFKPNFSGINFVKEAAKTRLWGRPADIIGDERVVLTGADLSHADLQGCTLAKADLRNARLQGADLRRANLAGALLNGADLTACDLRGANLDNAQLAHCRMAHANLSGASLKNANFAWADLSHAIVGARNLMEANVFGAVRNAIKAPQAAFAGATQPALEQRQH